MFGDKTVGFLITPTNSTISNTEAEVKKNTSLENLQQLKSLEMSLCSSTRGTAYDLASGNTDIPFVAERTKSDTIFETTDILQENTAYKNRLASLVFILSPQRKITPATWLSRENATPDVFYNIEIISE